MRKTENWRRSCSEVRLKPIQNGILEKRGHGFFSKTWHFRQFLLCSDTKKLQYYDINRSAASTLKGEYLLTEKSKIGTVDDIEGRGNVFSLTALKNGIEEELLFMSAPDAATKDYWMEAIQDVIHGASLITQPAVWPTSFRPSISFSLTFDGIGKSFEDGSCFVAKNVIEKPRIAFKPHDVDDIYSVVIIREVLLEDEANEGCLQWFVVNVPGSDVQSGIECVEYSIDQDATRDIQNYFVLLFKQASVLDAAAIDSLRMSSRSARSNFDLYSRAMSAKLGHPVGVANFFVDWSDVAEGSEAVKTGHAMKLMRQPSGKYIDTACSCDGRSSSFSFDDCGTASISSVSSQEALKKYDVAGLDTLESNSVEACSRMTALRRVVSKKVSHHASQATVQDENDTTQTNDGAFQCAN